MDLIIWVSCPRHGRAPFPDRACYLCLTAEAMNLRQAAVLAAQDAESIPVP